MTDKTIVERMDAIVTHIATCGAGSISREDELSEGANLSDEIRAVLKASRGGDASLAEHGETLLALQTISDVWGSGFDLASGEDFVGDDDTTVANLIEARYEDIRTGLIIRS